MVKYFKTRNTTIMPKKYKFGTSLFNLWVFIGIFIFSSIAIVIWGVATKWKFIKSKSTKSPTKPSTKSPTKPSTKSPTKPIHTDKPDPNKCNYDPKLNKKCDKGSQVPATNTFLESFDEIDMRNIFGLNPPSNCITAECDAKSNTCSNLYTWKNFKTAVEIWNHVFKDRPEYPKYFNYSESNDNKLLLAAIMANCKHESAHFNACKERLASKGYSQCPGKKVNSKTCLCDLNKTATGLCPPEGKANCSSGFTANTGTTMTYCCDGTGCEWGNNDDKSCYLSAWENMSSYRKQLFISKNRGDCNATCTESELSKSGSLIQKCVVCKDTWGATLNNAHCYFGRGPTQLTWSVNYKKVSVILDEIPDEIWCQ